MNASDISDNKGLPLVRPKLPPRLDPSFCPASLSNRFYRKAAGQSDKTVRVDLALERPDGTISRRSLPILHADHPQAKATFIYLERMLKFLLWSRGASRVHFAGPKEVGQPLHKHFRSSSTGKFDARTLGEKIYGQPFEFLITQPDALPPATEATAPLGRHWDGCRLGFDLGASDRKVAAVKNGKAVYTEEFPWDPRNQSDPQWHFEQIMEMLKKAAEHLPRVDAIGGSSAGVIFQNEIKLASLFRGVPENLFDERVKGLFLELRKAWDHIPFDVVNDGEVTALAGSMGIKKNKVLGIAMGSSQAAGYVDRDGHIMPWLNELAFAPVDYNPMAPVDEWSGDYGCGVQYFSQQAVGRLIPAAEIPLEEDLSLPERLVAVQDLMAKGDERARHIYQTLGTYLGYTLPHYAEFYDFETVLVLGRVLTGEGGNVILETARSILAEEFPEHPIKLHQPGEKEKRHGQAMAAASLPVIPPAAAPSEAPPA